MIQIKKTILSLVALIAVTTGAWAQGYYDININFDHVYNPEFTFFMCNVMGPDMPSGTLNLSVDGVSKGSFDVDNGMCSGEISPALDAGDHTWYAEFIPEGGGEKSTESRSFTIDQDFAYVYIDDPGQSSIEMGVGESRNFWGHVDGPESSEVNISSSNDNVAKFRASSSSSHIFEGYIDAVGAGTATITVSFAGNKNYKAAEDKTITVTVLPAPIEVTTNKAEGETTFTEASFQMPAFDATAEYELVRDMGYKVAFSGVPTRARLAKDGNGKFHFADGLTFQLLDNIDAANPKDITSAEGITFMVGEMEAVDFEGNTFYQLNKATLVPLADFLADAHLGNYAICAVASTGEYDGSFSSGRIELFQGYEVEVAAKEFITYYKDEPLYVEDEAAELYTIESVNGDQAVLSDRSDAMPSNTPMLVYNKSNETKVILLIPCAEPDMAITVAPEFQGTLTGTTIAASTDAQTNYAFNGKAFVFVKNAIEVGPNKAWLSISNSNARAINLVFDSEATGVGSIENGKLTIDNWYDLNGRKLDKMPTKKGVYLFNGRKVVVK